MIRSHPKISNIIVINHINITHSLFSLPIPLSFLLSPFDYLLRFANWLHPHPSLRGLSALWFTLKSLLTLYQVFLTTRSRVHHTDLDLITVPSQPILPGDLARFAQPSPSLSEDHPNNVHCNRNDECNAS